MPLWIVLEAHTQTKRLPRSNGRPVCDQFGFERADPDGAQNRRVSARGPNLRWRGLSLREPRWTDRNDEPDREKQREQEDTQEMHDPMLTEAPIKLLQRRLDPHTASP